MNQINSIPADEALDHIHMHDSFVLDVRRPEEFEEDHLENATNIPINDINDRLEEIPEDKDLVIYCLHGIRSGKAAHYLLSKGYTKVSHITDGITGIRTN